MAVGGGDLITGVCFTSTAAFWILRTHTLVGRVTSKNLLKISNDFTSQPSTASRFGSGRSIAQTDKCVMLSSWQLLKKNPHLRRWQRDFATLLAHTTGASLSLEKYERNSCTILPVSCFAKAALVKLLKNL